MILTAACAFGLEAIVKRELVALGYEPRVVQPGRISFEGDWPDICRANVFLRTADRVLIEIQQFDAPDFEALFETIKRFDWSQFIPAEAQFPVVGKSRLSKLTSLPAVQRSVKRALVESLKQHHGCEFLPETGAMYKVEIALLSDIATLTIDTTGPSLHKRGYRQLVGEAPIKETLAAALVDLSVWNQDRPLVDPFCGSGTIPIEAALLALRIAPGTHRQFACNDWHQMEPGFWKQTATEATDLQIRDVELQISGFDINPEVLKLARLHAQAAGVEKHIHFQHRPFSELRNKRDYGCLITNPPYGERLSEQQELVPLYESMPMVLQRLPTWSHFILTSMPKFESIVQKRATRRRKLFNGRIECTYYQFLGPRPPKGGLNVLPDIEETPSEVLTGAGVVWGTPDQAKNSFVKKTPAPFVEEVAATPETDANSTNVNSPQSRSKPKAETPPVFAGLQPKDREQAELFRSRLVKRARHLRRWPAKRGITCLRLYERDIPELPFVVDRYEDFLHITEYERPHERNLARHASWLELMVQTAASALEIPIQRVFLKSRRKTSSPNSGKSQYTKLNHHGKLREVQEGGLKFLVNLSDYVDTGLFLDHRITRQMVREEAAGKRFLNLFAYTGSFSVYAAAGGADSTTTVDLSRNYLDWAIKNMQANGFTGTRHQYIALDALTFIENEKLRPEKYDLAVVDPPTYSNSKRTAEDWDVQQHHARLLISLADCLTDKATVYFSSNLRTIRLDEATLSSIFTIREITTQTIPEDFRNKRIHRCWKLIKRSQESRVKSQ